MTSCVVVYRHTMTFTGDGWLAATGDANVRLEAGFFFWGGEEAGLRVLLLGDVESLEELGDVCVGRLPGQTTRTDHRLLVYLVVLRAVTPHTTHTMTRHMTKHTNHTIVTRQSPPNAHHTNRQANERFTLV